MAPAQHKDIHDKVIGLVFFSTPFRGTDSGFTHEKLLNATVNPDNPVYGQNYEIFRAGDHNLLNVVDSFLAQSSGNVKPRILCFYEDMETDISKLTGSQVFMLESLSIPSLTSLKHEFITLVNVHSGRLDRDEATQNWSRPCNHFNMNKFDSNKDEGYKKLVKELDEMIQEGPNMIQERRQLHRAFEDAIRDFKTKLGDASLYNQILETTSIDQVYEATDALQEEQIKKGDIRHLAKIELYLGRLGEYASCVRVFVREKPEILALIWGPLKLLLQWASVLHTSFDAIINTTSDIGHHLPDFESATAPFRGNAHIYSVLVLFFEDILEFYGIALRFFKVTHWKTAFESLWPRHRDKIKIVSRWIQNHVQFLCSGVRLEHIQQAHNARRHELELFEAKEKADRHQEYNSIKTDISPVFYDNTLDRLLHATYGGTGEWLMADTKFSSWLERSDDAFKLLWIQGIPGSGKTFLSSLAVAEAQRRGRTAFVFLSFRDSRGTSALHIIQSLMFQLASWDDDLQSLVIREVHGNYGRDVRSAASILRKIVEAAGHSYLVVDGLDEIGENDRRRLLEELLPISEKCSNLRILISSRPESDLDSLLRKDAKVIRVDHHNKSSIQTFVAIWVSKWTLNRSFGCAAEVKIQTHLALLSSKAKGMFLYARIVLDSIEFITNIDEIYEEIQDLPESLNDVYNRVLSRVNNLGSRDKIKARQILGWVACSPTPISTQELIHALAINMNHPEKRLELVGSFDFVRLCGPIIEVNDNYVQFVHFTVKEYITSPKISGSVSTTDAIIGLAERCVTYLGQQYHSTDSTQDPMEKSILSGAYTFHNYAARTYCELTTNAFTETTSGDELKALINSLRSVKLLRNRESAKDSKPFKDIPHLNGLKTEHRDIYELLCRLNDFHEIWSDSEFVLRKGQAWLRLDPLAISETSVRVHEAISRITSRRGYQTGANGNHENVLKWHGPRPFLCGYVSCRFGRYGFESSETRRMHEKGHDRPWKCNFPDCQYAEGGFLSKRMRDDHLDHFHKVPQNGSITSALEDNEKEFIFDLARTNKAIALKATLPNFKQLTTETQASILTIAASSGAISALEVLVVGIMDEQKREYDLLNSERKDTVAHPGQTSITTLGMAPERSAPETPVQAQDTIHTSD
ncbi:Short chain dehydrogenase sol3 [Apiospora arundinis]